jgi:hypothetical protein
MPLAVSNLLENLIVKAYKPVATGVTYMQGS